MGHRRGEFVTGTGLVTVPVLEASVSSAARLLGLLWAEQPGSCRPTKHQCGYSAVCMKNKRGRLQIMVCFSAKQPFSSSVDPPRMDPGAAGISMVTAQRRLPPGAQAAPGWAQGARHEQDG